MPPNRPMLRFIFFPLLLALLDVGGRAADLLLPEPRAHFTDYASIVAPAQVHALDADLSRLEAETARALFIVVYPSLPSGASLEEYPAKLAQSWNFGLGEKQSHGVLFVFAQEQQARIVVGPGLSHLLPVALVQQIVTNEFTPRARSGEVARGLEALTRALIVTTRGDDRGNKKAAGRRDEVDENDFGVGGFALILCGVVSLSMLREFLRHHIVYTGAGRQSVWINPLGNGRESSGEGFNGGGTGGSW